jgi:hypothetical protein
MLFKLLSPPQEDDQVRRRTHLAVSAIIGVDPAQLWHSLTRCPRPAPSYWANANAFCEIVNDPSVPPKLEDSSTEPDRTDHDAGDLPLPKSDRMT